MGRSPCCSKEGLNRGAWTALEDKILSAYIKAHGEGKWRNLPKRAGLKRCGKSCRLRWLNYLRPDIKRGNISHDEEELIIRLHKLLGNRWSLIAGRLPGRTDNEIKNYWNTTLGKKANAHSSSVQSKESVQSKVVKKQDIAECKTTEPITNSPQVIRTKATRCPKVLVSSHSPTAVPQINNFNSTATNGPPQSPLLNHHQNSETSRIYYGAEDQYHPQDQSSHFMNFGSYIEFQASGYDDYDKNLRMVSDHALSFEENACLEENATLDLESLAFLLDCDEWP